MDAPTREFFIVQNFFRPLWPLYKKKSKIQKKKIPRRKNRNFQKRSRAEKFYRKIRATQAGNPNLKILGRESDFLKFSIFSIFFRNTIIFMVFWACTFDILTHQIVKKSKKKHHFFSKKKKTVRFPIRKIIGRSSRVSILKGDVDE